MLKWFHTQEVDQFADSLIKEVITRYPPEGRDTDTKKANQRLQKVLNSLFRQIEVFANEHTLNIYKKARLGNRIKWAMREAGYPLNFSESFTHEVVTVISVINVRTRKAQKKHVSGK